MKSHAVGWERRWSDVRLTEESARSTGTAALYRVGAAAAVTAVATTLVQVVAFVLWPPPDFAPTPEATARIFADARLNPALTFVRLDGLMLIDYVALLLVFVALFFALRSESPSLAVIGTVLGLVAATLYLTANPAPALLILAHQWALASTDAARTSILGAGVGVLANFQGAGFLVHYVMMGIAGIVISAAMLRSTVFSRATGIFGVLQGAMMLVPSTFGTLGVVLALGSLVPFVVWFSLVATRLMKLARDG